MEYFYAGLLGVLVLVAILLNARSSSEEFDTGSSLLNPEDLKRFLAFRCNYLVVFCLMMAGDWLQGPYIYALYEYYGYTVGDIGHFFIMGFGSSLVFGTVVGALADITGRRNASLAYVAAYCLSCVTKHSSRYWVLMVGRMLGGVATSLLFSCFESWLVAEHNRRGFPEALLADTFSKSVFLGAGLMAILSGLAGNLLVEDMRLGPVAPFDAAICVLLAGGALVAATWPENYGDAGTHKSVAAQLAQGLTAIRTDQRIALLGAMQSMFEASMYTFVFLWTPALSPHGEKIPHGLVFSCFMTACMAGSAATGILVKHTSPHRFMGTVYGLAALSLAVPVVFHLERREPGGGGSSLVDNGAGGLSLPGKLQLLAFCGFEACIGVFWPSMMALRASYVPEELRSTIINIFRIPLNIFVCLVLYNVSAFPLSVILGICVGMLVACMLCQARLNSLVAAKHGKHREHEEGPDQHPHLPNGLGRQADHHTHTHSHHYTDHHHSRRRTLRAKWASDHLEV